MRNYLPKNTSAVQAIRVPEPTDRGAWADFSGEVIRAGWADEVRVMKPREATEKSAGSKGGVYLPLTGARGRTVQPGTWVARMEDGTFLYLTDEDMGARYQITDPQLPLEDARTPYIDPVTVTEPDGGTPGEVLEDGTEWEDSDDPTKRPKSGRAK